MPPVAVGGRRAVALQGVATLVLTGGLVVFAATAIDVAANRDRFDGLGVSIWQWVFTSVSYDWAVVALIGLGIALLAGGPRQLRTVNAVLGAVSAVVVAAGAVVILTTRLPDQPWFHLGAGAIVEGTVRALLALAVLLASVVVATAPSGADEGTGAPRS